MFELADYLTGIYKVKDCTDSNTIQNIAHSLPKIMINSASIASTQQTNSVFDELRSALSSQLTNFQTSIQQPSDTDTENVDQSVNVTNISIATNAQNQESIIETSIDENITIVDSCVDEDTSIAEPMQIVDNNEIETVNHS